MSTWQKTSLGKRIQHAFDHRISIFIVIHDKLVFQQLVKLNSRPLSSNKSSNCLFKWFGEEDEGGGESDTKSVSTINERSELEFGVMGLRFPIFIHEKRRASLPVGFLFGRKSTHRKVDVYLGESRTRILSRVHFAIGLDRDHWCIRGLSGVLEVIGITDLGPASPSFMLHPEDCNALFVGGIRLDIYCGDVSQVAHYLRNMPGTMDQRELFSEIEVRSCGSLTTIAASKLASSSFSDYFHLLRRPRINTRTTVTKLLALDAWSCDTYVAKVYPALDSATRHEMLSKLQARQNLLNQLPHDERFIRDERVYEPQHLQALYLLTPYWESISPLAESISDPQSRANLARGILWRLIRLVGRLHQCGITHGDICTWTVLADDGDDAFIYLAGFSDASADMHRAKDDCLAIFRTVHEYLKPALHLLQEFWIGHESLDKIWTSYMKGDYDQIPTVQEAVEDLKIDLSQPAELWTHVRVFKDMDIKHSRDQDVVYLDIADVKEYLHQDARCCIQDGESLLNVARLAQNAWTAISACAWEGKITLDDYEAFVYHMKKTHASTIGETLNWALGPEVHKAESSPLRFTLSARVPYNIRYGLVNLEFLRGLMSSTADPQVLQPFISSCLELRGSSRHRGIYVPISKFGEVTTALGLRFHAQELHEAKINSIWKFTHREWYFITSNELSDLFPVKRATNTVHPNSLSPMPLSEFLPRFFPKGTYLDSQVVRDPELLLLPSDKTALTHSCGGSVPTDLELEVRTRVSKKPRLSNIQANRRDSRTEDWVAANNSERRKAKVK